MLKGIKICGISDLETLSYIIDHRYPPNFIGFISNYKKSKRYVTFEKLRILTSVEKKNINFVSVLVNPNDEILEEMKGLNFDYYQLYDVEPNKTKMIKEKYGVKIITALTIKNKNDVNKYKNYLGITDIFLFDGKGYEKSISFDHKLLNFVPNSINKMIAGDIKIDDISNFNNKNIFVDLSGALENEEGKKDIKKINELLNLVKKNET
jgi:phosphoribosylanthranilate isomerase